MPFLLSLKSYHHFLAEISVNSIPAFFDIIQNADFFGKVLTFSARRDIMYNVYLYLKTSYIEIFERSCRRSRRSILTK